MTRFVTGAPIIKMLTNRRLPDPGKGSADLELSGVVYGVLVNDSVNEEWRHFVCCEAAACREHAVRLEPGESHALTQTLSVA